MSESRHAGGRVVCRTLPLLVPPTAPDAPEERRVQLPQGELAQLRNGGEAIGYLAVLELRPGTVRGNHVHQRKRESVYLIEGSARLVVEDPDSGRREERVLAPGDLAFIPPGVPHAIVPLEPGRALEFAPEAVDPADTQRHLVVELPPVS